MKQIVTHEKLRAWQGGLLILGIVAALMVINYLLGAVVQNLIGYTASSIAFWCIGGVLAYLVFRRYIAGYSYELSPDMLRICRCYGKRERHLCDIYLNRVLFVGDREEARRRYGKVATVRALRGSDGLPVTCLVYDTASGRRMALLQANDALKQALVDRVRKK